MKMRAKDALHKYSSQSVLMLGVKTDLSGHNSTNDHKVNHTFSTEEVSKRGTFCSGSIQLQLKKQSCPVF